MKVETIPYHYDNFSYVIICPETGEGAIVDPGEYYPISQAVEKLGVKVTRILCTHHHADHIGGLEEFCKEYPGVEVVGYRGEQGRIPGMTLPVDEGDTISVGRLQGEVVVTPGHTRGSVCFLFDDYVFTGDTLFGGGCGRLFEGTPAQMYDSLQRLVQKAAPATKICFGHEYTIANLKFGLTVEPENIDLQRRLQEAEATREQGGMTTPSTMAVELATNPFLRCTISSVIATLKGRGLVDSDEPASVFTAVRALKDSF